jgi:hypothetical protein
VQAERRVAEGPDELGASMVPDDSAEKISPAGSVTTLAPARRNISPPRPAVRKRSPEVVHRAQLARKKPIHCGPLLPTMKGLMPKRAYMLSYMAAPPPCIIQACCS